MSQAQGCTAQGCTAQELVQGAFSPLVAVLSSPRVEALAARNNLSFVELLQPFCAPPAEGHIRDPSGTQCAVKNWKLVIRDVHWRPPQPTDARKLLNNAVATNNCERTLSLSIGNHKLDIPSSTPWFESWRDVYMDVQFASDHEFTKHFVSCMLVGSTSDGNVSDTFNNLVQQMAQLQNVTPPKLPKWFNSNVLRSYVLLHDMSTGNKEKAERAFESLKQTYGAGNCFFLCINSKTPAEPDGEHLLSDPWSPYVVRRSETNNDLNSNKSSLPRTPVDARAVSTMPANVSSGTGENQTTFVAPVSIVKPETPHPLSPAEEPETIIDSANSLQNETFSGSTESVSSYINANVWESSTTSTNAIVIHGAALSTQDIENIKQFVNDFAFKALLPYFERQVSALHEAVANRKGVSRSLLSATKRWFGTNKPGTNTNVHTAIYTPECPELQLRRLGDLWFMCGQWARAFEAYHTAKREFNADSAWLCYAGALEMAALSAFMADEPTRKTYMYMEESIVTYLNTCRMVQYAVRATLLSVQCLTSRGLYGEAAKQLIRMTSEDSDLRSAVLLEQAALCFINGPSRRAMPRKYAFHMVLAGNRYSKAGQKRHAYRCYKQAFQVYEHSGWRLAVDHVQFALGRLAGALRQPEEAARWLAAPLAPHSPQSQPQQLALLREYMLAHQQWIESSEEHKRVLPPLPLPLLVSGCTGVLCGGIAPLSSPGRVPATATALESEPDTAGEEDNRYWHKMEEMLCQTVQGSVPMLFKPTVTLYTDSTDNSSHPTVPQGEPVHISIQLHNPLKIPLTLTDVELLWRFQHSPDSAEGPCEPLLNEPYLAAGTPVPYEVIVCQKHKLLILESESRKNVSLSLTPLHSGDLDILGVTFKLCNSVEGSEDSGNGTVIIGKQLFNIRGPRLKRNKDTPNPQYGVDKRLQVKVTPCAPCLQMTFSEMSDELLCGELQRVEVELRNVGPVELRNLHVAVSHPECLSWVASDTLPAARAEHFRTLYQEKYQEIPPNLEERVLRAMRWRASAARHVTRVCDALLGGGCARATLLIRPSAKAQRLRLLAYYEGPSTSSALQPYRLLRHTYNLRVLDSVKIVAIPRRNIRFKEEAADSCETLNLAVEVKNISKGTESNSIHIELLEASLISQQWRLTEFVAAKSVNEPLGSHEKLHVVLRGCRNISHNEQRLTHSGLKIHPKHPETAADVNERPYCEFVTDFASPFDEDFDAKGQNKRHGALIDSMLVIRWKAHIKDKSTRSAIGQHYLWMDCFTNKISSQREPHDSRTVDAPILRLFGHEENNSGVAKSDQSLDDIVIYRLEHSGAVSHNFKSRKLCLVPVTLHVVNCFGAGITAFINMTNTSDKSCNVGWAGAVDGLPDGVRLSLGPFQATHVSVQAVCSSPGTYQLGNTFRVSCQLLQEQADKPLSVVQSYSTTSLLVVKQSH